MRRAAIVVGIVTVALSRDKTRSVFECYNIVSEGDVRSSAEQLRGLTKNVVGASLTQAI